MCYEFLLFVPCTLYSFARRNWRGGMVWMGLKEWYHEETQTCSINTHLKWIHYDTYIPFLLSSTLSIENCSIVDKIHDWHSKVWNMYEKHVALKVILFSPYLHGALHDRDRHDSIFYGDCLSVHEPGMGCKVKIKIVLWEWCHPVEED